METKWVARMVSVLDVADYILSKQGSMPTKKLQKLVYYAQAWSLVWDRRALFAEEIEAWDQGPVVRPLFYAHQRLRQVTAPLGGNPQCLDSTARETIDAILAQYGLYDGDKLGDMTHAEAPWMETPRNCVISRQVMQNYYEIKGLQAAEEMGDVSGEFAGKHLASQITETNWHAIVEWGAPVGREIWRVHAQRCRPPLKRWPHTFLRGEISFGSTSTSGWA